MSQVNVNSTPPGGERVEPVDTSGDRTAAAGINLITVLIVLAVIAVIAWYLFTGPLRSMSVGGSSTNVNVNPVPTVNVNPPGQQPGAPAPGGTGGGTGGTNPGGGNNNNPGGGYNP